MTLPNGDVYEGSWEQGKFQQCLKITYSNGNIYEGALEDYKKTGFGKFCWKNGERYEGMWKKGAMDGPGILYRNGVRVFGEWENNKLICISKELPI